MPEEKQACEVGTFSVQVAGQPDRCEACAPGYFSNGGFVRTCTPCPPGIACSRIGQAKRIGLATFDVTQLFRLQESFRPKQGSLDASAVLSSATFSRTLRLRRRAKHVQ